MKELIEVFGMNEINPKTRAKIIIKLGIIINHQHAYNLTESLVYELVKILDPENEILNDPNYKKD